MQYSRETEERAILAVRCSPFQLNLFQTMRSNSIPLNDMIDQIGVENGYTTGQLSELAVENYILWLIQVGVLRREVDGQGITDRFRLTPLGRQLTAQWLEKEEWPSASLLDRLYNMLNRYLRI
jgi:hypothetical protein